MNERKPSKFEEDCYAFNSTGEKVTKLNCRVLKREDCNRCTFYIPRNKYNLAEIEHCIVNYNKGGNN